MPIRPQRVLQVARVEEAVLGEKAGRLPRDLVERGTVATRRGAGDAGQDLRAAGEDRFLFLARLTLEPLVEIAVMPDLVAPAVDLRHHVCPALSRPARHEEGGGQTIAIEEIEDERHANFRSVGALRHHADSIDVLGIAGDPGRLRVEIEGDAHGGLHAGGPGDGRPHEARHPPARAASCQGGRARRPASLACSMERVMISVRGLGMRLESGGRPVDVLTDVTLEIPARQFVAIAGPSGSGKSTLLGLIAGLDRPTAGRIRVNNVDLTELDEDDLARFRRDAIGYVFQSFHLIPTLTALENVAVPLELGGDALALERARALLDEVGLGERGHHYPVQLSGGEQQRVAVARAVARRPTLLLADEPTGNLDSATGKQIIDLLVALNRTLGSTLVLVTHDPALAALADRVITLRDGRVATDEPNNGGVA